MGVYSEYLDKRMDLNRLQEERKAQLKRISALRGGRDVLVFAADLNKGQAPISINYTDLHPLRDQLFNLSGAAVDLIIETPGGSGEVAEDIVNLIRSRYEDFAVIVPGWAKSAGTIIAMAANEILMDSASALGPIDAQISWQGKTFSAGELLEGFDKIKQEIDSSNVFSKAYIPILQSISPGELRRATNAQSFAIALVTDWLARYKFKNWVEHSSTGQPVTDDDKKDRAKQIADALSDHRRWLTHGRSIRAQDLRALRLLVTDYSENQELADAVHRYHTLLQMLFDTTNIYKVFETVESQIVRFIGQAQPHPQPNDDAAFASFDLECGKCHTKWKIQASFKPGVPLQPEHIRFPNNNWFRCPQCGTEHDLTGIRRQIEVQSKKQVITEEANA